MPAAESLRYQGQGERQHAWHAPRGPLVILEFPMRVIVLGAGLLGVTSAYFLRQQGHDVTVIDRALLLRCVTAVTALQTAMVVCSTGPERSWEIAPSVAGRVRHSPAW